MSHNWKLVFIFAYCCLRLVDREFKKSQSLQTGDLPAFISSKAFWLASLFLMTVPYRVLFERYTGKVKLAFIKAAAGASLRNGPKKGHVQAQAQQRNVLCELAKLGQLHQSGALSDAEFAQAKARVLGIAPQVQPAQQQQMVVVQGTVAAPAGMSSSLSLAPPTRLFCTRLSRLLPRTRIACLIDGFSRRSMMLLPETRQRWQLVNSTPRTSESSSWHSLIAKSWQSSSVTAAPASADP